MFCGSLAGPAYFSAALVSGRSARAPRRYKTRPWAMYEGGSCSDLGTAGPLDLKRGQLMSGRLGSSSSHNIKEELTSSGAVEWPAGCGYRLPSWGAAAAPFDTIKGGVERVKVPAAELGRDRAAAYFSPGLYLSRDPLQPSGPPQRDAADQDKRISELHPPVSRSLRDRWHHTRDVMMNSPVT
ncbi:hypothetical protein FJT64_016174 [Amphibalanus amphitrite]|uniref:Uncharacterized protein n=1 Tax=Amphibalanus amphitrite TaxID=1232801 RepID=A0A6A4XBD5_AMPAM|nr:hypothetical protein FJT64_016174 [Amphibalanus amphitrite]